MQLQAELDAKDDEIHRMQIKLSDLLNEVNQMKNEYEKYKLMSESSDKLMKSLTKTYNTTDIKGILEKIESSRQEELDHLENRYKQILLEKDKQHKEFLEEIDQLMLEQENEINDLKQKNEGFQQQTENYEREKDYIKILLESERNQFTGQIQVLITEKNQLQERFKILENQFEESKKKEGNYLTKISELENRINENISNQSNLKEKDIQSLIEKQKLEKENFIHQEKELNKIIASLRSQVNEKTIILENVQKVKDNEIQTLQSKISSLELNLETVKKEKFDYINNEKQSSLKIADLESTIIKFGDQKNKEFDSFRQKEKNYENEIKELKEQLAQKDINQQKIEELIEYKRKFEQNEKYYTQKNTKHSNGIFGKRGKVYQRHQFFKFNNSRKRSSDTRVKRKYSFKR